MRPLVNKILFYQGILYERFHTQLVWVFLITFLNRIKDLFFSPCLNVGFGSYDPKGAEQRYYVEIRIGAFGVKRYWNLNKTSLSLNLLKSCFPSIDIELPETFHFVEDEFALRMYFLSNHQPYLKLHATSWKVVFAVDIFLWKIKLILDQIL